MRFMKKRVTLRTPPQPMGWASEQKAVFAPVFGLKYAWIYRAESPWPSHIRRGRPRLDGVAAGRLPAL